MTDKTKLSFQLTKEELETIRKVADKQGMSVSEYARRAIQLAIPKEERLRHSSDRKDAIDHAFDQMDQFDAYTGGGGEPGVLPLPPRKAQKGVVSEANRTHPAQRVTDVKPLPPPMTAGGAHPCANLLRQAPAHLRGQCQGTCDASSQRGRTCHWAPNVAPQCPAYVGLHNSPRPQSRI